ncbi:hypothetical protein [Actinomadura fibrosa]|uniref:Uncharacterized protein n=1 Tax=Actinomadura fibrosa TaxID=111802 RepID=A0ABW2XHZ1_9ACTN|nr:hypothetical protein [Actinomadura fibrosa]
MDTVVDTSSPPSRLYALGARLTVHGFETVLTARGLSVLNHEAPGCCDLVSCRSDCIQCRPRRDDSDRLWFFTSWGHPIAEAERVIDAAVLVAGYLRIG